MIVPYFPDDSKSRYYQYYVDQVGHGMPVFQGSIIQHGSGGIGSLFRSLAKSALPLLKEGGKVIGKSLLSAGLGTAEDVVRGKSIRQAATENLKESGRGLIHTLASKVYGGRRRSHPRRRQAPKRRKRRATPSSILRNARVAA